MFKLFIFALCGIIVFIRPRFAAYMIVILVPIMPKFHTEAGPVTLISLEEILVLMTTGGILIRVALRPEPWIRVNKVVSRYLAFLLVAVFVGLLALINVKPGASKLSVVHFVKLCLPLLTLLLIQWKPNKKEITQIINLMLVVSVLVALLGIFQHYQLFNTNSFIATYYPLYGDIEAGVRYYSYRGATATFDGHHAPAGMYFMTCVIVALWYSLAIRRWPNVFFYWIAFCINLLALTMTASRAAIFSAAVGISVIILLQISTGLIRSKVRVFFFVIAIGMLAALTYYLFGNIAILSERMANASLREIRGPAWLISINEWIKRPIIGYGFYAMALWEAHNGYIQIALVGGALLLFFYLELLRSLIVALWKIKVNLMIGWAFPLLVAIMVFNMSIFYLCYWERGRASAVLWVLLGLALAGQPVSSHICGSHTAGVSNNLRKSMRKNLL